MGPAAATRQGWPRPGASAAIFRGAHVLIVRRGKQGAMSGLWSLPGGHIEPGERAADAALRELREETGVEAAILGLVDVHDVVRRDADGTLAVHYVLAVYFGRWLRGEPVAGSDSEEARFVAVAELQPYAMTPGAHSVIARARRLYEACERSQQ
jgi:8-oxo-dGTP diphosphatase